MFKAKLKLESGNQKFQYDHQAAILEVTSLKISRLLPMTIINMHMKFEIEIPKQTWLTSQKPCHLQSPETENLIWPPGGHFDNDVAENQQTPTHTHKYCAAEVWSWYSKPK